MSYRNDFDTFSSDTYWTLPRIMVLIFVLMIGSTILGIGACALGLVGGVASNAAEVVKKELYPDALLRKYEWFKDASAALDQKQANIRVYKTKLDSLTASYGPARSNSFGSRRDWARDDREQWSIWSSELAGIKASYNSLAAEYNSQMSKLNWRFTNIGDLPPGASTPLPREFKPYVEE